MPARFKLTRSDLLALLLCLLATTSLAWLGIHQQDAFQTPALDLAKFDQAIWNTAQGRPFQITLGEQSVLDSHFSPALALFAPAYWLWPDIRLLAILQAAMMAGAGLLIYVYLRGQHAWLGLAVYAAYLMHPALHQVYLSGFRRETLAILTMSLVLFCLLRRRYGWMLVWMGVTLLTKEDMGFACAGLGLYLAVLERRWKLGVPLAVFGLAWVVLIPYKVMPALSGGNDYAMAEAYFSYLGHGPAQMARTALTQPGLWLHYLLAPARLEAVGLFFLPSLGLFLLAPQIAAFLVPYMAYMLLSSSDALGLLGGWYPSVLLVFLFWAVAVGAQRLPRKWQLPAAGALVLAGLACWVGYSQVWPGRNFQASLFQVSAHDQAVDRALQGIPAPAVVAAQDALVPHLAHRQQIYLFPWQPAGATMDDIALDRDSQSTYPISQDEYHTQFYNYLADPTYPIVAQVDGFYLFGRPGAWQPAVARQDTWDQTLTLSGYRVTLATPGSAFQETGDTATTTARVELFWQVASGSGQNLSGYVHVVPTDDASQVLAESDSWPDDGFRPTSVLKPGEAVRDVRYLSWAGPASGLSLLIGLRDSQTSQLLSLPDGQHWIIVPLGSGS